MSRLLLLLLFIFLILVAPVFAPYDPMAIDFTATIHPPNQDHLLGTDQFGRDVLSRLLHGGRTTLFFTLNALLIAITLGGGLGLIAGFLGGRVDTGISLLVNVVLSIPGLLFGLMLMTLLEQRISSTAVTVGLVQAAPFAQFTRTIARSVAIREDTISGYAIGASRPYILYNYVLRGSFPSLLMYTSVTFGYCLLNISAFGFLGLSGTPGLPEWGMMLAEGREILREAPWVSSTAGTALTLLVLTCNLFAQHLSQQR